MREAQVLMVSKDHLNVLLVASEAFPLTPAQPWHQHKHMGFLPLRADSIPELTNGVGWWHSHMCLSLTRAIPQQEVKKFCSPSIDYSFPKES